MNTPNVARMLIGVSFIGSMFGCAKLSALVAESVPSNLTVVTQPFDGYGLSPSDIFSSTVTSQGGAVYAPRYTMTGNGDVYGTVDYANGAITIQRPDVTGPCDDTSLVAPACGFTWGSGTNGVYHGGDYNFFPNATSLSNEFKLLKYVQVDIHHELATGSLSGGMSDCGLDLGFGTGVGASGTSNNFSLPGHAGTTEDIVKFMHRYDGGEKLLIEAPLNNATDSSYTMWGLSQWAGTMSTGSLPTTNGNYVDFRMWIVFDHVAKTATIITKPLATSGNLSALHTQTVVWPYTNDHAAVDGSEPRGGLMFGTGTNPVTLDDFETSRASIGFLANGVARKCGYTNLQIGLLKEAETVSTPLTPY